MRLLSLHPANRDSTLSAGNRSSSCSEIVTGTVSIGDSTNYNKTFKSLLGINGQDSVRDTFPVLLRRTEPTILVPRDIVEDLRARACDAELGVCLMAVPCCVTQSGRAGAEGKRQDIRMNCVVVLTHNTARHEVLTKG